MCRCLQRAKALETLELDFQAVGSYSSTWVLGSHTEQKVPLLAITHPGPCLSPSEGFQRAGEVAQQIARLTNSHV